MEEVNWQIAIPTGHLAATYRGIRIVIKLGINREPLEIGWFIGGFLSESISVTCDLESAKKLGMDVIDDTISKDERWQRAEEAEQRAILRMSHPQRR